MKPQALNDRQTRLVERAADTSQKYKARKKEYEDASAELNEDIGRAIDAGVTKYRVAQETGFSTQAIESRVDYIKRAAGKQPGAG